jgi:copper chaperone
LTEIEREGLMDSIVQNNVVEIDNLKCGGCANTITKALASLTGVMSVFVDMDKTVVSFDAPVEKLVLVLEKLQALGYPQKGSTHGFKAGLATA